MPSSRPSSPTTPPATTTSKATTPASGQYQPQQYYAAPPPPRSHLSSFTRWLRLKRYQYEVTFSLYMLTPTEKFIFNFILLTLLVLLLTAATLYLPAHVSLIYTRIWYYVHGELKYLNGSDAHGMSKSTLLGAIRTSTLTQTITESARVAGEAAERAAKGEL